VANAARKLDRSDANLLREVGQFMARKGEYTQAASIFQRINDTRAIVQMHVQSEHWEDVGAPPGQNCMYNLHTFSTQF
jgi:hypothetical protein